MDWQITRRHCQCWHNKCTQVELIKNIEIKNFKSIRHQKIEDCRRVNIFIGYPNVGKSNILEALSIFGYLNKGQDLPLKLFCRFKELIDLFYDGDKQKDAEIFLNDYVSSMRYLDKNTLELAFINKEYYVEKFDSSRAGIFRFFRFDKNGGIVHRKEQNYELRNNVKKYEFKAEGAFINSGADQRVLSYPNGSNLAEVIRHNRSLRKECAELFSTYNLKIIFDENENIIVQKSLDEFTAFQFSISQVADTLQRLIFHKAAINTNQNTALLFEEPESHMFPPYISKFTADVMYNENNNQFFMSTHSPFVVNDFMENLKDDLSVYIVGYNKDTGETIIRRLTQEELIEMYQFGTDIFLNLENYLENERK